MKTASASFLKKRSKKLLVAGGASTAWGDTCTDRTSHGVIANLRESGGKQSIFRAASRQDGLLRCARNDGLKQAVRAAFATAGAAARSKQKFFGSFFQKRTSCLTYFGARSWT